ncbi:MAG: urease accessory protein UreD [Cyanobacteria bacterium SID2]|nr:urease accessory protein UreD [Cyanobacteria bacterium SID2]MBP0006555.1 urease accessory protein UreD [Cyanobacteria bacterium SBC]
MKPWHGKLKLTYEKRNQSTRVFGAYSQSPLKIQRSFHPEGKEICHSVILHTAGGIVGGDRLSQQVHLQSHAEASITTVAASKVYRSNEKTSQQTINLQLDDNAYLEYLPRETIVFDGAIYRQDTRIELGENAVWLGWEIVRFGRTARGERFHSGVWRSNTEVWQNRKPLWIDRTQLKGGSELLDSPNGLNGQPVIATFCWIGQAISEDILKKARMVWQARDTRGEIGLTRLDCGLIGRYRGRSTQEALDRFLDLWQLLRWEYRDRSAIKIRAWQN